MKKILSITQTCLIAICALSPTLVFATDVSLANLPLAMQTEGARPNVLMLIDDSGSMTNSSSFDVFYAPSYDSDYEYRCSGGTLLPADNAKTLTTYVSLETTPVNTKGTPYFTYGTAHYAWGAGGAFTRPNTTVPTTSNKVPAGESVSRICFIPDADYKVILQPTVNKTNTVNLNSGVIGSYTYSCPTTTTWRLSPDSAPVSPPRCFWRDHRKSSKPDCATSYNTSGETGFSNDYKFKSPSTESTYCYNGRTSIAATATPVYIYADYPYNQFLGYSGTLPGSRVFTGNFLNWYFSATAAQWSSNISNPGYTNYGGSQPWWTQSPASNFNDESESSNIRGMKPEVSFKHQRMSVARDVAKLLMRKLTSVNIAIGSFATRFNASRALGSLSASADRYSTDGSSEHGGSLMHGLIPLIEPVDDPTTTDDDAAYATAVAAISANQASLIKVISQIEGHSSTPTSESMVRMARYLFQGWETENFKFYTGSASTVPRASNSSKSIQQRLTIDKRTTGAANYSADKNITASKWCQKSAIAVLTDGQPTDDTSYGTDLISYDTTGSTQESAFDSSEQGIIRVSGALFDHDWLPNVQGVQNIESYFIAFGAQSVVDDVIFDEAGKAGGGGVNNSYAATDGGAVVDHFNSIIESVKSASLSVTAVAVSAITELKTTNFAFQANYNTEYFTSEIRSFLLDAYGYFVKDGASYLTSAGIDPQWEANDVMGRMYVTSEPGFNANHRSVKHRRVYTWNGVDGTRFGIGPATNRPATAATAFTEFTALPAQIRNDIDVVAGGDSRERYDLMMYLLGDPVNEQYYPTADTLDNEKFRQRGVYSDADSDGLIDAVKEGGLLGDIVDSSPVYVQIPVHPWNDANYGTSSKRYSEFKSLQVSRSPMLYVGANDGYLHAISVNAKSKSYPSSVSPVPSSAVTVGYPAGGELFAYMPLMVTSTATEAGMHYLAKPKYDHLFYVDQTPTIADVFMDFYTLAGIPNAEWRSVLVGGLRRGGKGYFALDVTCPFQDATTNLSPVDNTMKNNTCSNESFNESNILWEFDAGDDNNMGFSYSEPIIAQVNYNSGFTYGLNERNGSDHGRWAMITGNGYNSATGRAALFIVFLDGGIDGTWTEGVDYIKIYASNAATDTVASKNGLSSPTAVDLNNDGMVDRVYAGDLKGQMWAFDISAAANVVQYGSGSMPWVTQKLFTTGTDAANPQPITVAPVVGRDTSKDRVLTKANPDLMVSFGTGRYLGVPDIDDHSVQTLYSVLDRGVYNLNRYSSIVYNGNTYSTLAKGIYKEVQLGTNLNRTVSGDAMVAGQFGWYTDFASDLNDNGSIDADELKGERLNFNMFVINDILIFKTTIPTSGSCSGATQGWTMFMDWTTGGAPKDEIYDANGDGVIDSLDKGYVGKFNVSGGSALSLAGVGIYTTNDLGGDVNIDKTKIPGDRLSATAGWEERMPFGIKGQ